MAYFTGPATQVSETWQHGLILHLGESTAPRLQSALPKLSQEHGDAGDGGGCSLPSFPGYVRARRHKALPERLPLLQGIKELPSTRPTCQLQHASWPPLRTSLDFSPSPPIVFTPHACQGRPGSAPEGADPGKASNWPIKGRDCTAGHPSLPLCRVPGCTCLCLGT